MAPRRDAVLNRLLWIGAGVVAGTLVATPAVLGLSGNSSFSRDIPIREPSGARHVQFVAPTDSSAPRPSGSRSPEDHPGHHVGRSGLDDSGGLRGSDEPGDDRRHGDDDGRHGDDDSASPSSGPTSDDSGRNRGPGGDDGNTSGSTDNSGPGGGGDSGPGDNSGSGSGDDSGGDDSGGGGHGGGDDSGSGGHG